MFKFIILVTLFPFLAHSQSDFPVNEEYGPIARPTNPTKARDLLGYDTFQRTAKNFNNVQYGNHWEQFDTPELKFNPEFRPVNNNNNYRQDKRQDFNRQPYVHDQRDRNFDFGRDSYRDYKRNY